MDISPSQKKLLETCRFPRDIQRRPLSIIAIFMLFAKFQHNKLFFKGKTREVKIENSRNISLAANEKGQELVLPLSRENRFSNVSV